MTGIFGWRRQSPDHRDLQFQIARRITTNLPASQSLLAGMGPQLNQDALGSCGPNTADEVLTFDQIAEKMAVGQASRLYIYYNTRYLMGTTSEDSGVDNRTMMQALARWGYCPESLWPYNEDVYTQRPPLSAYQSGAQNRISSYATVAKVLAQMQGCLVSGRTFIFGFDCFDQIMSDQAAANGILTDPPASASSIGGHDVTICGYNASGKDLPGQKAGNVWPSGYFIFRNHWLNDDNSPWGDNGYGYISFPYATGSHADDFWVINAVPKTNADRTVEGPWGPHPFHPPWGPHPWGPGGVIPGGYVPGGYMPGGYVPPVYPGGYVPGGYMPGGYIQPPVGWMGQYAEYASNPAVSQAMQLGIPWQTILGYLAQGGVQALEALIQSLIQPAPQPMPVPVPVPVTPVPVPVPTGR